MRKKELIKRYILCIISLFVSAFGVALTKHGELGVSPISSVANILSYCFPALSMGTWLILWSYTLILAEILILRKNFKPLQLLQFVVAFLFGYFTDFGLWCISGIPNDIYIVRLLFVISGVIVLGFGISLAVASNTIMNAGEAFVKVLADTLHKDFGKVKICFDITCVTSSILLSLLYFHGQLVGTREGTIIAAFCTGMAVSFFNKRIVKPINEVLKK